MMGTWEWESTGPPTLAISILLARPRTAVRRTRYWHFSSRRTFPESHEQGLKHALSSYLGKQRGKHRTCTSITACLVPDGTSWLKLMV